MPVAIRAITRLVDADDINVSLGAGVDEYALCWDNDTAKFVLRAPFASLLATGATVGATSQAQNFTVGVTVGSVTTPATLLQVAETSTASPRGIMSSQHSTSVDGARFHMRKSRGTNAAPVVVVSGDALGRLVASGYDGSNYLEMGGIDIVSAGTIASTRVPTEIRFLTATDAAPSVLTQRMVIDKAGNVGIGTTSPETKLHISDTYTFGQATKTLLLIKPILSGGTPSNPSSLGDIKWEGGGDYGRIGVAGDNFGLDYNTYMAFWTNSGGSSANLTEKMRITSAGNVGIGTTSPTTKLHVAGQIKSSEGVRLGVTEFGTCQVGGGTRWVKFATISLSGIYQNTTAEFRLQGRNYSSTLQVHLSNGNPYSERSAEKFFLQNDWNRGLPAGTIKIGRKDTGTKLDYDIWVQTEMWASVLSSTLKSYGFNGAPEITYYSYTYSGNDGEDDPVATGYDGTHTVEQNVYFQAGIRPIADSTTALRFESVSGTNVLNIDTTNGRVGIGTTSPATRLDIDAGAMTMAEMTAPTGVANKATLYTKDNGSGKTQLCVKLGDDVEIVIATQA